MGTWGSKSWENDAAADWYANLFDETGLAQKVESTLKRKKITEDNYEQIRAAAFFLVALGRVYIWPIDRLNAHLALAFNCLEKILKSEELEIDDQTRSEIQAELDELRRRISPGSSPAAGSK
jgi:hypothetical protein